MKTAFSRYHGQRGTVLVTTLVMALLVGLVVAALLFIGQQQNYFAARAMTWNSEIPLAEAGIEEAMAHLNTRPTNWAVNGWSLSGSNYIKSRTLTNGYYYTAISKTNPPAIVSIGYGRIPLQTNYTQRRILAMTKLAPPGWGVVGKSSVSMNGNPYVDSYLSSAGSYSLATRRDRVGVGTLSAAKPAIDTGGGQIYGSAATGPGGTVSGSVGDGTWLASSSGQQPGHVTDDFNMAIPDIALPSPWSPQPFPVAGLVGGILYNYVLTPGDYTFDIPVNMSSGGIYVSGSVRIYFKQSFKMSGTTSVTLAPGATLDMYMGSDMDLSGQCVINPSKIPANCHIYGLPTCTSMKYSGTAEAYCQLYAPEADITITGTFDFFGSAVGNNVRFSGTANIHYDEALNGGPEYKIVSWEEL